MVNRYRVFNGLLPAIGPGWESKRALCCPLGTHGLNIATEQGDGLFTVIVCGFVGEWGWLAIWLGHPTFPQNARQQDIPGGYFSWDGFQFRSQLRNPEDTEGHVLRLAWVEIDQFHWFRWALCPTFRVSCRVVHE